VKKGGVEVREARSSCALTPVAVRKEAQRKQGASAGVGGTERLKSRYRHTGFGKGRAGLVLFCRYRFRKGQIGFLR